MKRKKIRAATVRERSEAQRDTDRSLTLAARIRDTRLCWLRGTGLQPVISDLQQKVKKDDRLGSLSHAARVSSGVPVAVVSCPRFTVAVPSGSLPRCARG